MREKRLDLLLSDDELNRRRAQWQPPETPLRGYARLYREQVLQATEGCDFGFLRG